MARIGLVGTSGSPIATGRRLGRERAMTMRNLGLVLQISGALLLALGIILWTGTWEWLVVIHVAIGIVLVLTLWTIAYMASRGGVSSRAVWSAGAWGAVVVGLGLAQEEILSGTFHWVIQVLHLGISMGAIVWGRYLLQLMQRQAALALDVSGAVSATRTDGRVR